MIRSHTLRKRDLYLDKLIAFQDTEPIKVVTGIRRCGKSSLLKLMAAHLRGNGVSDEQIIEMNFESYEFLKMTADELYRYVKERVLPDRRIYLFFDELQRMDGWENAVNSFRVDFDCDIYITGSNAYLLSSEYSTYLSGRCVEIKMLPLSFAEFVDFYGFTIKTVKSALGGQKKKAVDQDGTQYELREIFDAYMRFGGMPGIADVGMEQDKALTLLEGIYSTVIVRDILEREKRRGQQFEIYNIFNRMSAVAVAESKQVIPQADVHDIIFTQCAQELSAFDVKSFDFIEKIGLQQRIDIGLNRVCTWLAPAAAVIEQPFTDQCVADGRD